MGDTYYMHYNLGTFFLYSVFCHHIQLKSLKNVAGFERRTLHSSLALLSFVGAIGRAGLRKEVGLLRPGPCGPKVLRHQMVR